MKSDVGKIVKRDGKYYKLAPPDGGWGYVIAAGMVVVMVAVIAPMGCYGMIYEEFFEMTGISMSSAGLQNGISVFCCCISGFMTNIALKRFSLRQVGLFGSVIYGLGSFGSIFMNSLLLFIAYGSILAGSGVGIMFTCSLTAMNMYFDKKKVFVMSICQTLIAILTMLFPMLVNTTNAAFGFRGTMAVLTGIGLQTLVAFALHHSVDDHIVLEEVQPEDFQVQELEPLNPKEKESLSVQAQAQTQVEDNAEKRKNEIKIELPKSKMETVIEMLDLSVLRDTVFLNISIGLSVAQVADLTLFNLLPLYLSEVKWTNGQVAYLMTLVLVGDTTARALLAIVSRFYRVNARALCLSGITLNVMLRFVLFIPDDMLMVTVIGAAIGFCRCFIMVTPPLILSDHVATDKYAAAQGLQMFMMGILSLLVGPIAGAIRDATGSYVISFHAVTCILLLVVLSWTLELLVLRARSNRKINEKV